MQKLIINLAPTGMVPTREMNTFVPLTPAAIAADVTACVKLGVSMAHIHAREEDMSPTYKKEIYADIISRVRANNPDLVVVVSTSGRTYSEFEKRSEVLTLEGQLKPDMASLTLGSFNFPQSTSNNSPQMIEKLALAMKERGIKPELEIFDLGMVNFAKYLISKGILEPPYYFNILLGNVSSAQANLQHLGLIVSELPPQSVWCVAGIGRTQLAMNALGLILGSGIRIGLEDNLWYDDARKVPASNVTLCQRMVKTAEALERPLATAQDVRELLKLGDYKAISNAFTAANALQINPIR